MDSNSDMKLGTTFDEELREHLALTIKVLFPNEAWTSYVRSADCIIHEINAHNKKSFEGSVEYVIRYLNENCHPHTEVIIDGTSAKLVEGIKTHSTDKFIKD